MKFQNGFCFELGEKFTLELAFDAYWIHSEPYDISYSE